MSEFVSEVDHDSRKISVRTIHGAEVAKKMAWIRLLEDRVRLTELLTSSISFVKSDPAERWYVFSW